jgi:plastocyanin
VVAAGGESGTGVTASINLVSGRNVSPIWPSQGGKRMIEAAEQSGIATDVDNVQVATGDTIRFEVHGNGNSASDAVSWTPSIGYVANKP